MGAEPPDDGDVGQHVFAAGRRLAKLMQKRALLHLRHRIKSASFLSWTNYVEKRNFLKCTLSKLFFAYEKAELYKGFYTFRINVEQENSKLTTLNVRDKVARSRFCSLL